MRIHVLIKNPGINAREFDIENDLKTLQHIVGGYIETTNIGDTIVMITNEEGKLRGLEKNFEIYGGADYVAGPAIFAGVKGDDFASLDEFTIKMIDERLRRQA